MPRLDQESTRAQSALWGINIQLHNTVHTNTQRRSHKPPRMDPTGWTRATSEGPRMSPKLTNVDVNVEEGRVPRNEGPFQNSPHHWCRLWGLIIPHYKYLIKQAILKGPRKDVVVLTWERTKNGRITTVSPAIATTYLLEQREIVTAIGVVGANLTTPIQDNESHQYGYNLHVDPSFRPIKQKNRKFSDEKNIAIQKEVEDLIRIWVVLLEGDAIRVEERMNHLPKIVSSIFKEQIGRNMEIYIDDMLVKSRMRNDHSSNLRESRERLRLYRLRINPEKCSSGVTLGKFLAFIIVLDEDCSKAFLEMKEYLGSPKLLRRPDEGEDL
ncbi:hypothetical protein LIER_33893 [Lithospermum erythrorhizon]|uniref:Reverse transcriptase domain-containing protein n=1 Tax=Lithospermum erythrorhizon TaxID=34254 RepID=A0AAV3S1B3_LITER